MCGSQEFDEFRYNTCANDILDGGILFLGKQFTKFSSSIILLLDVI